MRPDDITPEERAAAGVEYRVRAFPVAPMLAAQNALRDERVRKTERDRIAQEIETQATERFAIARDQRAAKLSPAAEESYTIASTLAEAAALVREGGS